MPRLKNFKQENNNLLHIASAIFFVLGILTIAFAFTPTANPPQCEGAVQTNCIIGANIGAGLIVFFGVALIALAFMFLVTPPMITATSKLVAYIDARAKSRRRGRLILTVLTVAMLVVIYFVLSALMDSSDSVDYEQDYDEGTVEILDQ